MKKLNLGAGALVGAILTAPLIGVMYLADQLGSLPFVPFDLFDWLTRVLPGPLITFGIDLMIDTMLWLGVSVADTAKNAEQIMAVLQFFVGGIIAGIIFFAVVSVRNIKADSIAGIVMGALFGLPFIAISIAIGQSTVPSLLQIGWLSLLFLAWGLALSWTYRRLMPIETETSVEADKIRAVERLSRRQFLIRFGATSAIITVVGAGVGAVVAQCKQHRLEPSA